MCARCWSRCKLRKSIRLEGKGSSAAAGDAGGEEKGRAWSWLLVGWCVGSRLWGGAGGLSQQEGRKTEEGGQSPMKHVGLEGIVCRPVNGDKYVGNGERGRS